MSAALTGTYSIVTKIFTAMHYVSENNVLPSSGEIAKFSLKKETVCLRNVMYCFLVFSWQRKMFLQMLLMCLLYSCCQTAKLCEYKWHYIHHERSWFDSHNSGGGGGGGGGGDGGDNAKTSPITINPLQTKRRPLYLKTQSVPRCKQFLSRL